VAPQPTQRSQDELAHPARKPGAPAPPHAPEAANPQAAGATAVAQVPAAPALATSNPEAAAAAAADAAAPPPQVASGCNSVCKTKDGFATCGYRMQWAATHRYKGQAQACDLAMVLVLLDCKDVCGSCNLEHSGCAEAVATGVVDPRGSPSQVALQQRHQVKVTSDRPRDNGSTPVVASMAASFPMPEPPKLPKVSLPNVIAGFSAIVIFSACGASFFAKILGWGLPAPRAAAAAAEKGSLRTVGPPVSGEGLDHGYGNTFAYEGLVQEQDDACLDPQSPSRSPSRMRSESPTASKQKQKPWF